MTDDKLKGQNIFKQSLAYLARREHTRMDLEQKLIRKGYSSGDIQQMLDKLENDGFLSHERFIESYIQNAKRKGYGPSRIHSDLKYRKQLNENEIEKGLRDSEVDWVVCARRCCEKKFGGTVPSNSNEHLQWRNYLFGRGFSDTIIKIALDNKQ